MPLTRWTWTGLSNDKFTTALTEFRPTDRETVREMMAGRYLLASKLVDTGGVSPFQVEIDHAPWRHELQSFSWLRHFRDARDEGERRFARTLALDWIGRDGRFDRDTWAPALCAQRVMNWLRHFGLLIEAASPVQESLISKVLGTQIQSLKLRGPLAVGQVEALYAATALVGVALCDENENKDVERRFRWLMRLLDQQIDADGLHLSRSGQVQLYLLVELVTIKQSLGRDHRDLANELGERLEIIHRALDALTLGTGEPAFFNGTGQVPHDLLIAVQAQSSARKRESGSVGGYGLLISGLSIVIADSGVVPPPDFADEAHAGALGFEFSHGSELVFGSCGPAPAELPGSRPLFRQGIAHSAPTINAVSAAAIAESGVFAGRVRRRGAAPEFSVDAEEASIHLVTHGYESRFGVTLERRVTLLSEGKTLVGQDRMARTGKAGMSGVCTVRFHLAPGAEIRRGRDEDILRVRLTNGAVWTFLWEGAEMREEESVRQSAYFGFHRIRQLVLEAPVSDGAEIAWIFTLEE